MTRLTVSILISNIFIVRVGGGYLSIDEFLDQYTPLELEKIERKDPLKRFSEKIVVQKTLVGKEVKETSPVRIPQNNYNSNHNESTRSLGSRMASPKKFH